MAIISKEILKNVHRLQIRTGRTVNDLLAGAYLSAFKGKGMEFEDVREYEVGDDVRSIDWNVTARMQHPYVKNFREERELTTLLLVDVSASTLFGTTGRRKQEYIAEIGAVLAFSAVKNNDKVGLILFSDKVEKYLPPKKGLRHVLRLIRELLVFKPEGKQTNIKEVLSFLAKVQKRQGVCFLLSDFLCELPQRELALIARRHDLIGLAINDPREWDVPSMGLVTFRDLESGKLSVIDTSLRQLRMQLRKNLEERLQKNRNLMRKVSAGFVSINTRESYVKPIHEYFHFRERQR